MPVGTACTLSGSVSYYMCQMALELKGRGKRGGWCNKIKSHCWHTAMAETPSSYGNLPYFEASTSAPRRQEASWGLLAGLLEVPLQRTSFTGFPCKFGGL